MCFVYDKIALTENARRYCDSTKTSIAGQIGMGLQGIVFETGRGSAVKVHGRDEGYRRERDAYRRLEQRKISSIQGLAIPRLLGVDDELRLIEMSFIRINCILDFGGAYLDRRPDHMMRDEEWMDAKAEEFGENWEKAQSIIREIEFRADMYMSDVNNGNIKFEE